MAYKSINFDTLSRIMQGAHSADIDLRLDKQQRGKVISARALVRNGTGDEANTFVQVYIDDEANIAYVAIACNSNEKFKYLQDKIAEQTELTPVNESEYDWNESNLLFKLQSGWKFVNNGNTYHWANEVLYGISNALKVVANIVY